MGKPFSKGRISDDDKRTRKAQSRRATMHISGMTVEELCEASINETTLSRSHSKRIRWGKTLARTQCVSYVLPACDPAIWRRFRRLVPCLPRILRAGALLRLLCWFSVGATVHDAYNYIVRFPSDVRQGNGQSLHGSPATPGEVA